MGGTLAKNTTRRAKARGEAQMVSSALMEEFDKSKTGSLNRDEVKALADSMLNDKTPLLGGLTDEEIDMLMRISGDNTSTDITAEDLPTALSVLMEIRADNKMFYEMFQKYDTDSTGVLKVDQLHGLLAELTGLRIAEADIRYVLTQCEPRGKEDPIPVDQLKAAIACWYCLSNPTHDKIKTMFKAWDTGGTGVISLDEMTNVMKHLKAPVTGDEIALLFQSVDTNHNGSIEYNEFVDWVLAGGVPMGAGVEEEAAETPVTPSPDGEEKKKVAWSSGWLVTKRRKSRS